MTVAGPRLVPLKRVATVTTGAMPTRKDEGRVPVMGANGQIGFTDMGNLAGPAIVVGRVGSAGAVNVVQPPAWITDNALVVIPDGGLFDFRYASHVFSTLDLGQDAAQTAQPLITQSMVRERTVPLPSLVQQRAIAAYLDAETAHIDALIELRRQQMSLSSARRFEAARAVFRGNGAPTRRLAWAPGVPLDWPLIHLRWLTSCLDGRRIPVNREDRASMQGDIPYWGANGVVDHVDAALFDEPLVLLGEDGAPFFDRQKPKAFFVDTPVWVNNHIHVLRAHGIRPRFLTHYLNLVDYADFVGGSTRDKLTQDDMGSIPVPVPPIAEQERIEQEISVSQRWADEFESATEHQIGLLMERRQVLITGAVTGQLQIPGVAA